MKSVLLSLFIFISSFSAFGAIEPAGLVGTWKGKVRVTEPAKNNKVICEEAITTWEIVLEKGALKVTTGLICAANNYVSEPSKFTVFLKDGKASVDVGLGVSVGSFSPVVGTYTTNAIKLYPNPKHLISLVKLNAEIGPIQDDQGAIKVNFSGTYMEGTLNRVK